MFQLRNPDAVKIVIGVAELHRQNARIALSLLHLSVVIVVTWLLFGEGIQAVSEWLNLETNVNLGIRRRLLFGAAVIYFLRTLLTILLFLKRRMGWAELITVAALIGAVQVVFAYLGGQQTTPVGAAEVLGVILYVGGSYLNSCSEYQRYHWKQQPQHTGQLYSEGLFRYAMHINYFGDLLLFTGWVLVTGWLVLFIVPGLILFGFVFVHIPSLDQYLAERYGDAFQAYATRTKKLIPFIY